MARMTQDREDLLREATALVPRVMLRMTILGQPCEVFAGFRGESLSLYYGASPVYHFNQAAELRRAYLDDRLVKAEKGRLVGAVRKRTATEVALVSAYFSPDEVEQLTAELTMRLGQVRGNLEQRTFDLIGQEPPDAPAVDRLQAWLVGWPGLSIAATANVN